MHTPAQSAITLPRAVFALVAAGIAIFAVTAIALGREGVRNLRDAALEEAVTVRTRGAEIAFARALEQDWQRLQAIAGDLGALDARTLRALLDAAAGAEERISWAGFATPDGRVIGASGGLLEGGDVSGRPWFRRGLQGPFAGDVHDALLLAEKVPAGPDGPARFLDMSTPVIGEDGRVAGVLGFHINAGWAEDFLTQFANATDVDLLLVEPNGTISVATSRNLPEVLDLPSLRAAAAGAEASGHEIWPDGTSYFTKVLPSVSHGDLPSFGWRLVGRVQPEDFLATPERDIVRIAAAVLPLGGAAYLFLTFVFMRLYLRPIEQLAGTADLMAAGHETYPLEFRAPAEAQRISAALARLEAQRD